MLHVCESTTGRDPNKIIIKKAENYSTAIIPTDCGTHTSVIHKFLTTVGVAD